MHEPRDGWRVWVTRDEDQAGPLCAALRGAGRVPVLEPVLEILQVLEPAALARPLQALTRRDWLVLTSARAVESLPRITIDARVGVVGRATRRAAEAAGLSVSLESCDGTAAGLWKELDRRAGRGVRVLFPRAELAEVPTLTGVEIDAPIVYATHTRTFDRGVAARVSAVAFASPSAVRAAAPALAGRNLVALSIGPTTSAALASALPELDVRQAAEPTFAALARIPLP